MSLIEDSGVSCCAAGGAIATKLLCEGSAATGEAVALGVALGWASQPTMQPALPKLPLSPCDVSAALAGHSKTKSNNGSQRRASLIDRGRPLLRQDLGRLGERI